MKRRFRISQNLLLKLLILTLAAGVFQRVAAAAVELDRIVAVVNDDVIMQSELSERLRQVKSQLQEQGTPLPPTPVLQKQVLDRLILSKLQLEMAHETGIRVDDETLNQTIKRIADQNKVTLSQFRTILEKEGYSYDKFREDIRNEILITRLRQREVDNRVIVTDREVDNYLATEEHQGKQDIEYHLRHILISVPDNASVDKMEQTRQVAEKVLKELRAGKDFKEVAVHYSDGQQALDGGDLGWRKASEVPTLFAGIVADMKKGDISDLIKSPSGYHIIKLVDVRDSGKHVITQTHARHILIRTNELVTDQDAKQRLEQLRIRILGGDSFADLAKAHSNDTVSAAKGGDLGWISPGDLVPEFEEVMDSLKPGEVSEPFKTQFGWHIVQVLERRQHDDTEDLRRAKAREAIRARKLEEARENWLREMRDEAYVEYRLQS